METTTGSDDGIPARSRLLRDICSGIRVIGGRGVRMGSTEGSASVERGSGGVGSCTTARRGDGGPGVEVVELSTRGRG